MENFYDIDHPVLGILGGLGPAARWSPSTHRLRAIRTISIWF